MNLIALIQIIDDLAFERILLHVGYRSVTLLDSVSEFLLGAASEVFLGRWALSGAGGVNRGNHVFGIWNEVGLLFCKGKRGQFKLLWRGV